MARLTDTSPRVLALLDTIAACEIGAAMLADPRTDDGYRVLVGSTPGHLLLMTDYSAHPMPDDSQAMEYAPGIFSTAAGRYQILNTYWPHYRDQLGLPNFGPESQDRYAIQQLREQNGLAAILDGDMIGAVLSVNNIWASLPGSPYGQHTQSWDYVRAAYSEALRGYSHATETHGGNAATNGPGGGLHHNSADTRPDGLRNLRPVRGGGEQHGGRPGPGNDNGGPSAPDSSDAGRSEAPDRHGDAAGAQRHRIAEHQSGGVAGGPENPTPSTIATGGQPMNTLQAIRALNAALLFGLNGVMVAQRFGRVIEQAQAEGRDINEDEWKAVTAEADAADADLARAIRQAAGKEG